MENNYCIGIDFGTDSVRAIVVDAANGDEIASSVFFYPLWKEGLYCNPSINQFRQHPSDYLEGLEHTVKDCVSQIGAEKAKMIKAISADTTGSTPVAVDETGKPLALLPAFEDNPNAMFLLWKDHTSIKEAVEINTHSAGQEVDYLKNSGGIYSSEWFWAKILHVLRTDKAVRDASFSWVEHCDWIPFLLTGGNTAHDIKRNICAAGHKGLWSAEHGGLPPTEFFATLDPLLESTVSNFGTTTYTASESAGTLCKEWADKFGLSEGVIVGIGALDAHMGAVGGQIKPYFLSKVMGTSTCDMLVVPKQDMDGVYVKGICGQVDGSIIPNMIGLEAGQSAFGDIYAWFKELMLAPLKAMLKKQQLIDQTMADELLKNLSDNLLLDLELEALKIAPEEFSEIAVDWFNGRRTPDADQFLQGAIAGLTLASNSARVYRTLIEATCFGARKIKERFVSENIPVKGIIGLGGISRKSPLVMQTMADVLNMPILIHASEQTCAAGAAMFAATVSGIYEHVEVAMDKMGKGFDQEYLPRQKFVDIYDERYRTYEELSMSLEKLHKN